MSGLRRPGGRWRLLVHEWLGRNDNPGTDYGMSHHVSNNPTFGGGDGQDSEWSRHHVLPASCEFDELVVGSWCHIEAMDSNRWWMNISGVTLWVDVDRDGKPRAVSVYMPGSYADPVPGVEYHLTGDAPEHGTGAT